MKVLNLGYGLKTIYSFYQQGNYPSQLLYGMVEIQKKGIEVEYASLSKKRGIKGIIENTKLVQKSKCDIIFFPYIYSNPILGIAILKLLRICKIPILGVSHSNVNNKKKYSISYFFNKIAYQSFSKIFFHSPLNMEESIKSQIISPDRTELLHWGADLSFYLKNINETNTNNIFFISTGKENRDFKTLLESFSKTNLNLEVYTNITNYTQDYSYLLDYKQKSQNILISLVENSKQSTQNLARRVADSFCVLIPLNKDSCNYCVGHTSIVEALALGKPIIVSTNDYHPIDVEKENVGIKVKSSDPAEWIKAITYIYEHKEEAKLMGENGKKLAREKYNIEICANEILDNIIALTNSNKLK
nr:glycosyltransferase [uncultured Bacteroides sp.]